MKILAALSFILLVIACDPYGFGFTKNPAFVLDQALKAIQNTDDVSFREVSGKEALCLYGNKDGMTYLHEKVTTDAQNVQLKNKEIGELQVLSSPEYVGYWAYLRQRYVVEIQQKSDKKTLGSIIVDCNYGVNGEKKESYLRVRDPKKLPQKECRIVKIMPATFSPIPMSARCQNLVVTL